MPLPGLAGEPCGAGRLSPSAAPSALASLAVPAEGGGFVFRGAGGFVSVVAYGSVAEPVVYLEGGHYASIIPLDREGFDTNGAHYGFSKVSEYTSFSDGVVGFAANQSALASATRIPQSIMNNPAYITKYAYQIPELGVNVLYVEWANANNGTMNAGIFYLCGMELAKADAAAVLVTDEFQG